MNPLRVSPFVRFKRTTMSDILLGAWIGSAAVFVVNTVLSVMLLGETTKFDIASVATSAALTLLFLFGAVLTYVGVL